MKKSQEMKELATYVQGMADITQNEKLSRVAALLTDAARHVCAQGYYGCEMGDRCTSDHK